MSIELSDIAGEMRLTSIRYGVSPNSPYSR